MPDLKGALAKLGKPRVLAPALLFVLVLGIGGALAFWFGQWIYVVIALLVVLIGLLGFVVHALYARERDERSARGTGAGDEAARERRKDEQGAAQLAQRFQKAAAVIEARSLAGLPWYLAIGLPGSGKTSLLRASGLELPSAVESLVEAGPTSSCSFWLTNQAVLVDAAGRLCRSHEGRDHEEWKLLLSLIRKQRAGQAVQGVIVALSAADLLGRPAAELAADASELRRHLNEIVDELGVDPPVYLAVTQADRLQGFADLAVALGGSRLVEAFGWTSRDRYPHDVEKTVRDALARLRERIERVLPELLVREPDAQRRRRLFLLPQELGSLGRALASFIGRAFQPTRYDEVPFLRGVFLTSALRDGPLVSPLLAKLGHAWAADAAPAGPSGSWFARDLFRKLLLDPEEQSLAVPTDRVGPRTRWAVLGFAGLLGAVLLGLWGASFHNNLRAIGRVREAALDAAGQSRSLAALDGLRAALEEAERARASGWHGFGLGAGLGRALARGGKGFAAVFGSEFERPAKAELLGAVRELGPGAFSALLDLVADVGFMAARGDPAALRPALEQYSDVKRNESERRAFAAGYAAFVRRAPRVELQSRVDEEQRRFDDEAPRLLEIGRLEAWCAERSDVAAPVRASDLGLSAAAVSGVDVPGCYTRDFYERWLGSVFASLERSGTRSQASVLAFRDEYARRYADAWRSFLVGAPRPARADPDVLGSPYLTLLTRAAVNTNADGLWRDDAPGWVRALHTVRQTQGGDEKHPAAWKRYLAALDAVASEVERARGRGHVALKLAHDVADGVETPFTAAVELSRELVPIGPGDPDQTAKLALRSLLLMPVLNGFSAVLEAAVREIDLAWKDQVVAPFPPPLTPEAHERLYAPGGALERFRSETLGGFWAGSAPRPLLEDRALPLSDHFVAFAARGGAGGGGGGGGGALPTGPQTVRLIGAPSEVRGAAGVFVTGRRLTLACATREEQVFEYAEGVGEKGFVWTPDCDYVQLSVSVRLAGGQERQLTRDWNGSFAFAAFLREGRRAADGAQEWELRDPLGGELRVAARYKLRGGEAILRFEQAASQSLPGAVN